MNILLVENSLQSQIPFILKNWQLGEVISKEEIIMEFFVLVWQREWQFFLQEMARVDVFQVEHDLWQMKNLWGESAHCWQSCPALKNCVLLRLQLGQAAQFLGPREINTKSHVPTLILFRNWDGNQDLWVYSFPCPWNAGSSPYKKWQSALAISYLQLRAVKIWFLACCVSLMRIMVEYHM